jgi:manganese transport protein
MDTWAATKPDKDHQAGDGLTGWRRERGAAPLGEVNRSILVPRSGPGMRKFAAFLGPGYLVAVGYMDPGN